MCHTLTQPRLCRAVTKGSRKLSIRMLHRSQQLIRHLSRLGHSKRKQLHSRPGGCIGWEVCSRYQHPHIPFSGVHGSPLVNILGESWCKKCWHLHFQYQFSLKMRPSHLLEWISLWFNMIVFQICTFTGRIQQSHRWQFRQTVTRPKCSG